MSRQNTNDPLRSNTRVVWRLLLLSWSYRGRVVLVFSLAVLLVLATLAALELTGLALDVLQRDLGTGAPVRWPFGSRPPAHWSLFETITALGAAVLVLALSRALLTFVYELEVARLVHAQIVPGLRKRAFACLQRLSFRFFDTHSTAGIINRLTRDVQLLRSFVDGVVVQGAVLVLTLVVFVVYMLQVHVALTLVSLSLLPLLWVATRVFSRWAEPAYAKGRELVDRMVGTLTEMVEGIVVIKSFGLERERRQRFDEHNQAVRDQQLRVVRGVSLYAPSIDLLTLLNIAVLLVYGAHLSSEGVVSLGQLVVFAGLLQQFATRASAMAGLVDTLLQSITGARRVFEVLDRAPEVEEPSQPLPAPPRLGRVGFERVSFGYDPDRGVLSELDFEIAPGTRVGIVGATGAGKSTLLSLIPRFYDPLAGRVCLDGVDVRQLRLDDVRSRIGIVFQETFLFRDSVAANIAWGQSHASLDEIVAAARLAGAHEFIQRLPGGYEAELDEDGGNLSGGQRQRLALARALLPKPSVLLLDDPTSALDAQTEAAISEALSAATHGRTTLLVSSRVSLVTSCDEILVIEHGRIAQRGSPRALLTEPGAFRDLAELQGYVGDAGRGGLKGRLLP